MTLALLVLLAALWGASFLFIAIAVPALGAIGVGESRALLGGLTLLAFAVVARRRLVWGRSRREYLLVSAFNVAIPFALIPAAQLHIPASLAAIVNATAPLFSAILAVTLLGEALGAVRALGLGLGIGGVALVVGLAPIELDLETLLAVCASLGAACSYAIAGNLIARRFQGVEPVSLAIGQQLLGALMLAPLLLADPPREAPNAGDVAAILGLAIGSSAVGYLIYFHLIDELGATGALSVTYLVPVFGVLWAALFRDEELTWGLLAGGLVVIAGVVLVTRTAARAPALRPPAGSG